MKTALKFSTLALLLSASLLSAAPTVAPKFANAKAAAAWVAAEIKKDPAAASEIAAMAAASSPQFAGEITQAAITASNANDMGTAAIVEAVAKAAPEQMDVIANFAVAVRPEAGDEVNAVRATINPASSPLDFPSASGGGAGSPPVNPQTGPGGSTTTGGVINQYNPPIVDTTPATRNDRPS